MTACADDRPPRDARRAEGRVIDEPFADLYVVAGSKGAGRLFALDLLNLEMDPLSPRRIKMIGECGDRLVVRLTRRSGETRTMSVLDGELTPFEPAASEDCESASDKAYRVEGAEGWRALDFSPNGRRVLLVKGRRLGVAQVPGGSLEVIGRIRFPIRAAVWARR
jgi:hypothetical protein